MSHLVDLIGRTVLVKIVHQQGRNRQRWKQRQRDTHLVDLIGRTVLVKIVHQQGRNKDGNRDRETPPRLT